MNDWTGTAYALSELGRDLSTGNILDVAPQQDSTFLPLASNGAIGFKVEEDGSKQAQLTTGTFGVTQSPWNVPNRPACSPSLGFHQLPGLVRGKHWEQPGIGHRPSRAWNI